MILSSCDDEYNETGETGERRVGDAAGGLTDSNINDHNGQDAQFLKAFSPSIYIFICK